MKKKKGITTLYLDRNLVAAFRKKYPGMLSRFCNASMLIGLACEEEVYRLCFGEEDGRAQSTQEELS